MREVLTPEREANAIRLRRSTFAGTFLLVEGSSDKVFYERFVNTTTCTLVPLSGKPSSKLRVIAVLDILEKSGFEGVLAIVDADFDRLEGSLQSSPNLIYTETHDLETLLLKSPALDKVIAEFGSEEKMSKFSRGIRTALVEAGMPIGYFLWISKIDRLELTFSGIDFGKFIDHQTLKLDESKLIQEVKNKSQKQALKNEGLQQRIANQKNSNHDPWQVCCGHHLVEIFAFALRKAIGTAKNNDVKPESLERCLRLAYEEAYFRDTQIYLSVRSWETNNQPFKVLRDDL